MAYLKASSPDLFDAAFSEQLRVEAPLADRLRPQSWADFVGQTEVVGPATPLRKLIDQDQVPSIIFWGPPGSGKTTLARLIARNKAQQDALLPYVEKGVITLIGATTENPSFEVVAALLSRCRVVVLKPLLSQEIAVILRRALKDSLVGFGGIKVVGADAVIDSLATMASGDARVALNALELAVKSQLKNGQARLDKEIIKQSLQRTHLMYDKAGEEHYNIISALHKSMRGGEADAALYWLGRMLEAGEDPLYVARRLIRFASEDIGLAEPQALVQATAAFQAAHDIGMPECNVVLAQCVAYLARAPKSNALYTAYQAVQQDVKETVNEGVPLHLRNAPTELMKDLGYGKGYKYNPDYDEPVEQTYLPESLKGKKYLDENPKSKAQNPK